jgi:hypothetical protein
MSCIHRLKSTACLILLTFSGGAALAADDKPAEAKPPCTLTGHIDLVSHDHLRGATKTYGNGAPLGNEGADAPESDKPAPQWGADCAGEYEAAEMGHFHAIPDAVAVAADRLVAVVRVGSDGCVVVRDLANQVTRASAGLGVSRRTVFRWLAAYRDAPQTSSLLARPRGTPTGARRIDPRLR